MLNVLFPERRRRGTALCLAVVQVFWLLLPFEKFSLSSRSTTDKPWLRFPLISYYVSLLVRTLVDRMWESLWNICETHEKEKRIEIRLIRIWKQR